MTPPKASVVTVTMSYCQPERDIQEIKRIIKKKKPAQKRISTDEDEPDEKKTDEPDEVNYRDTAEDVQKQENNHEQSDTVSNYTVTHEALPLYHLNPEPRYPERAKRRGYEGLVELDVLVDRHGLVSNLFVSTSSGYMLLDNAAVNTVKDWIFQPGTKEGDPSEMWIKVPIRFELKK